MKLPKGKFIVKEIKDPDRGQSLMLFLQRKLGSGNFGDCYLGVNVRNGVEPLAIKQIKRTAQQYQQQKLSYNNQLAVLLEMTRSSRSLHKNEKRISNLTQVYPHKLVTENHFYIAMELCDGDLSQLMTEYAKRTQKFTISQFLIIMGDLINGYGEMKAKGFIHEDLKPHNIFVKDNYFKIGDFGLSYKICTHKENAHRGGTPMYLPPQKCHKELKPTYLSDIYSLGVILYQLYYGGHPYFTVEELRNSDAFVKVNKEFNQQSLFSTKSYKEFLLSRKLRKFDKPHIRKQKDILSEGSNQKLESLILSMISKEVEGRPSFERIQAEFSSILPHKELNRYFRVNGRRYPQLEQLNRIYKFHCSLIKDNLSEIVSFTHQNDPEYEYKISATVEQLSSGIGSSNLKVRVLFDLYKQLQKFELKYADKEIKKISQTFLELILVFNRNSLIDFQYRIAEIDDIDKLNFYEGGFDRMIGVMKNNQQLLKEQIGVNIKANHSMFIEMLQGYNQMVDTYLKRILLLSEENFHIVLALDLAGKILGQHIADVDKAEELKSVSSTNGQIISRDDKLFKLKNRILFNTVTSKEAIQVYLQRQIKFPVINLEQHLSEDA